jgi:hypothetical protein
MHTVYIETSIVSHATAWPSPDAATAVLQEQAKRWMLEQRPFYDLVTSQLVIDEAAMGARTQPLDGCKCWTEFPFCPLILTRKRWLTKSSAGR